MKKQDVDLIHASIAAQVYAKLRSEAPAPWKTETPIQEAVRIADEFIAEYMAAMKD